MTNIVFCVFEDQSCDFCLSEKLLFVFEDSEKAKEQIKKLKNNKKNSYFIMEYVLN